MKALRGTFPAGGVRGKSLADVYLANQGLEELADWLPQLYTRISSRCLGGALAPQRQYRGEETRPALVRSTDLIRKELRWADKQPHSVQWGSSRPRRTLSVGEANRISPDGDDARLVYTYLRFRLVARGHYVA